jgi:hypothetical protein
MAPQEELALPEARTTRGALVIRSSVAAYVPCRIEDDSSLTPVSEHENVVDGVAAGKHKVVVEDLDCGYGLYSDGVRVASFAERRIGYLKWARNKGHLGDMHAFEDPYDHDIDELLS